MKLLNLRHCARRVVPGAVLLLLAASPALAQVNHGDFTASPGVDFLQVTETTQLAVDPTDPAILFGAPVASPSFNTLTFNPPAFTASATVGNGKLGDETLSLLNLDIVATAVGTYIDTISIKELGDSILTGFAGDANTGTFVSLSGWVSVTEDIDGPLAVPVDIPIVGVFTPSDLFLLPGDIGVINWSGEAFIDVASVVPNATRVSIAMNNYLAAARLGSHSATIQKKISRGVVITVPEPSSVALIGLGLLFGVTMGARRRRD